jgi:2,4-dienoyl-CoA reductase-like NADH-dependent reductase (Old Yellow Enzyme family)
MKSMSQNPHLFTPYQIRKVTLPNRIVVSPMCQYSAENGFATDWHFVHLASRAVGGAGLVFTEATAVVPEGRISPRDLGLWDDAHVERLAKVVSFIHSQGAAAGIQLAHAGRKASMPAPWEETRLIPVDKGGWTNILGPSPISFSENYATPREMTREEIRQVEIAFRDAAARAIRAGFQIVEIHAAHGYLFHEFLSPESNHRTDDYGGSFENRARFLLETIDVVREVWPETLPLFVRLSATDWLEHSEDEDEQKHPGWTFEQTLQLSQLLKLRGVDLVDVSSGGNVAKITIPMGPGYQTGFSARIRREVGLPTGAVGMITSAAQADHIIRTRQADLVFLAREFLRDPYWPLRAAQELGHDVPWPVQYGRAASGKKPARKPLLTE